MDDRLERIHNASMTILEDVGIRLFHPEILGLVARNGAKVVDDKVFFGRNEVMAWVALAPSQFTLFARNPAHNAVIGGEMVQYAAGYGCPRIVTPGGIERNARFEDYCRFLKLVQQHPRFNINGGILAQPEDLPSNQAYAAMIYAALCHSDKVLLGIPGTAAEVEQIMDLVSIVFGGTGELAARPRILTLVNTISPLQIDANALDTLMVCTRYGQPVIISPAPMAGATGPITPAGNIALGNAEALAAIAICQMLRKGTPVVYGLHATTTDMRTGGACIGSPGFALQAAYTARLAKAYDLPSRAGGANTDAPEIGAQSGYESMLAMLATRQSGVNLILHAAGILNSYAAISYEKFMVDLEIMEMIDYYLRGVSIDDDALALDTIRSVGSEGEYLTRQHTLAHCRETPWTGTIGVSQPQDGIRANERYKTNIEREITRMLQAYRKPALPADCQHRLDHRLEAMNIDPSHLRALAGTHGGGPAVTGYP